MFVEPHFEISPCHKLRKKKSFEIDTYCMWIQFFCSLLILILFIIIIVVAVVIDNNNNNEFSLSSLNKFLFSY